MLISRFSWFTAFAVGLLPLALQSTARASDLEDLQDQAVKAAVLKVAPTVVQIETSGGIENIGRTGKMRKGTGPTTGVVVAADGYIITSSFNFADKPSAIFVSVPNVKERFVGEVVATDKTRMLTLLKLKNFNGALPLPVAAPKADLQVGQTALALGRTLSTNVEQPPSVSAGIVSALNRIWGKAIQTDAKVSPVNYGGPLVDLMGRVQGILVPASPQAADETSGTEWYDSGIGFAIPLEDIFAVLPKLKQGKELKKGVLGVTWSSNDAYGVVPTVGTVQPGSAAAKAGLQPGDVIKEFNGKPIHNSAQCRHLIEGLYEEDTVNLKILRDKKEITLPPISLGSLVSAFGRAFLGILPMRDDSTSGVGVRYVYPNSPADKAGIKAGDRITKVGPPLPKAAGAAGAGGKKPKKPQMKSVANRDKLMKELESLPPGAEMRFEVKRKDGDKKDTLTIKLEEMPDVVPDKLPPGVIVPKDSDGVKDPAPKKKPDTKKKPKKKKKDDDDDEADSDKPADKTDGKTGDDKVDEKKTGLLKRTNHAGDRNYWIYVPNNYNPQVSHALVLWLHPTGKNKDRDVDDLTWVWQPICEDQHVILVGPQSDNQNGWTRSDTDFIQEVLKAVKDGYKIDSQRIVAHGMGIGGEMAFYLGFHERTSIRGVAVVGAGLTISPKETVTSQPLSFFIAVGDKDPVKDAAEESKKKLAQFKYSVILHEIANMGHQYLDGQASMPIFDQMIRWIDSLDRI